MTSKRFSRVELATPVNSPLGSYAPSFGGRVRLQSQDRTLVDNGGVGLRSLEIYQALLNNPQVYSAWDKTVSEITSRAIVVEPASDSEEDKYIAKFVETQLKSMGSAQVGLVLPTASGLDNLIRCACTAYITGISPVELVWSRLPDGTRTISYFKPRDPKLFSMEFDEVEGKTRPRLLTRDDALRGQALPDRKFVMFRYWSVPTDDEYGQGLGRQLYYAVEWQKQILSFWLQLIDKTVLPSTIGSYDETAAAKESLVADFKSAVASFGQDSSIVLPPGFKIDTTAFPTGTQAQLSELLSVMDAYISNVITGESSIGQAGAGSAGKDQIANEVRVMKAKALSDLIHETLNQTVVRWLVDANFGTQAASPRIWRDFTSQVDEPPKTLDEVQSIAEFVDILGKLDQVGIKVDQDYIGSRLNVPLKGKAKPGQAQAAGGTARPPGAPLYSSVPSPSELLGG